ncbi:uncharacterized protein LOC112464670 [Temnothorax curvispinosus]|uniref:Uncharacterized protein LOC112464670 n=1 Tax=Temnothorax curvispinosus TaxID=300111 RepID=A0A6J1R411_9HYME|nr:uncharacterized protein LOC112464670 [Temnothorax curvispinosus]
MPAKRRVLQKTAIPKYNLPQRQQSEEEKVVEEKKKKNKKNRETRRMNREKLKESKDHVQDLYKLVMDHQAQQSEDLEDIQCNEEGEPNLSNSFVDAGTQTDSGVNGCEPMFVNKDVQTGSINVCYLIKNDKDLSTMTGIENFGILNAIVDILNTVYPIKKSTYDYKSKVILTFMKLKLNLSYYALAVLFTGIKLTQIRNVFLEMLTLLDDVLQYAVVFPSKKEIHKNMPTCFEDFKNTRVMIDCTEVPIQRPKNVCCRKIAYSNYKRTYTVKIMTGVTAGTISFLSRAYGGKYSDKLIFEQSGLINLVEKGEAIMVDKGFLIDHICLENQVILIRPPFLRNKKQFSRQEALLNAKIAKARVHVKRANQRLKLFRILIDKMPSGLVSRVNEIFRIISAIVNLSSPILKDCQFTTL